jgi:hypothetical protein
METIDPMKKNTNTYLLIVFFVIFFIAPINLFAAMETRVKICAVKGTVHTSRSKGKINVCPLTQIINKTDCRVINGDVYIETGPDGWAEVKYPNGSMFRMTPNSKIHIRNAGEDIYVIDGKSWFKVKFNKNKEHGFFYIKLPTAIAGIRGTEFVVEVKDDGSSIIKLIEGAIEVTDSQQRSKMNLTEGMEVSVAANSSVLNPGILNIKDNNKWWTAWPTLVPIEDKPLDEPGAIVSNKTRLNPIADSHVYAYSYAGWNKANWGKYEILGAGWNPTGGEKRTYLKFDVLGIQKSTFQKATLRLFHYHTAGNSSAELGVYTVMTQWNEGSGTYKPSNIAGPGEICWINQPQTDQYPVAYFNPGTQTNDFVEVDITTMVKSWLNGMPNYGLAIKVGGNYSKRQESVYGFYSREHDDPGNRPVLVINSVDENNSHPVNSLWDISALPAPEFGEYYTLDTYYKNQHFVIPFTVTLLFENGFKAKEPSVQESNMTVLFEENSVRIERDCHRPNEACYQVYLGDFKGNGEYKGTWEFSDYPKGRGDWWLDTGTFTFYKRK